MENDCLEKAIHFLYRSMSNIKITDLIISDNLTVKFNRQNSCNDDELTITTLEKIYDTFLTMLYYNLDSNNAKVTSLRYKLINKALKTIFDRIAKNNKKVI